MGRRHDGPRHRRATRIRREEPAGDWGSYGDLTGAHPGRCVGCKDEYHGLGGERELKYLQRHGCHQGDGRRIKRRAKAYLCIESRSVEMLRYEGGSLIGATRPVSTMEYRERGLKWHQEMIGRTL